MVDQAAATLTAPATTQAHETPDVESSQTPRIPPTSDVEGKLDPKQDHTGVSHPRGTVNGSDVQDSTQILPEEAQMDIARPSIEVSLLFYIRDHD